MDSRGTIAKTLDMIDARMHFENVYAHCDIPCGIYDPHAAQVAAHTVARMDMLIAALPKDNADETRNKFARYVAVKEQHAEICKHEIRVLWGDYFKAEHKTNHPDLNELIWGTLKSASKAKQSTNIADADDLLTNVMKIAEIFWETKGVKTKRVKAFYPTEREIVYPVV